MKKTLTVLAASTALTAAIGVPAWSAMQASPDARLRSFAALFDDARQTMPLVLASGDDDDSNWRETSRQGHDDDHDDDDDDEDDEDDDDARRGARTPAPAGTVAPPANGLFGTGAPPQVKVN